MSVFVNTNVVVYTFDQADPAKQRIAIGVLEGKERLVQLCTLPVVSTDPQLVQQAIETSLRFEIAIWDALIVEAARSAGCHRVLSEDLQAGQDFDGVVIENPFAP
jgi:predicted nucleic acid-binding protein